MVKSFVQVSRVVVLTLLVIAMVHAEARAQVPRPGRQQVADSSVVARFQLADAYFRASQYDRAIPILEDLYKTHPETFAFYDKLRLAYENVKRYDDAIALVQGRYDEQPSPALLTEKGRLLYLKGDDEGATQAWDDAIALAPDNENVYRLVYQSLMQVREFDRAIALLQRARETLDDPELFQPDLAYLYQLLGRYDESMQEYLGILSENENQFNFVRSRLSRFVDQEAALRTSIAAVARAVRAEPLNRAYRELLGWLYLEGKMFSQALDTYRAIDRLESDQGQGLFGFAQSAADAGAFEVALEAYQEILSRYPQSPMAPQALMGIGEMHERHGAQMGEVAFDQEGHRRKAPEYEQALASYRAFLDKYPSHPYYPEVLRRIGHLQQDVFFSLGEAETTLQDVIDRYPGTPAADQAEYDLARTALLRDSLEEARLRFSRLEERLRTGELAELARYELAQIHFYNGEFDGAMALLDVLDTNTSTDVANDAIELKVLLIENRGPDSLDTPLHLYANATLLERQHRVDDAIDVLDDLLKDYGNHQLADDARFLRASALRQAGKTEEALAAFSEIPLMHPRSFLADRSLFKAAEIQEYDLDDVEAAIETYTRLLADFPGSLLANEARAHIRRLRGDSA